MATIPSNPSTGYWGATSAAVSGKELEGFVDPTFTIGKTVSVDVGGDSLGKTWTTAQPVYHHLLTRYCPPGIAIARITVEGIGKATVGVGYVRKLLLQTFDDDESGALSLGAYLLRQRVIDSGKKGGVDRLLGISLLINWDSLWDNAYELDVPLEATRGKSEVICTIIEVMSSS